jgi:hypothetical protein
MAYPRKKMTMEDAIRIAKQHGYKIQGQTKQKLPSILGPVYEWFESRDAMFNRIIKDLNFKITKHGDFTSGNFCDETHDNKEITMIMKKTEPCFFGLFKNTEVYMPEGFEVRKGETEYYIHNTKKDNIRITTFSQGEKQLKKLLKDYKRCLDELKIKELESDF